MIAGLSISMRKYGAGAFSPPFNATQLRFPIAVDSNRPECFN